jgi:hypothetical protein
MCRRHWPLPEQSMRNVLLSIRLKTQCSRIYLDVQNLDLTSKLQHLVLDLADLERISCCAGCCVNLRVEIVRFGGLRGLTHVVHGLEGVRRHGREVSVGERIDEYCVCLCLCVASNAVADLELRVAAA